MAKKDAPKRPKGRQSTFTQEKADAVCAALKQGMTLREACRQTGMPPAPTVQEWIQKNEAFAEQYARAREIGYHAMADEIVEISDDGSNDWMVRKQGNDEVEVVNHEHISRSRLRVDTRRWLLSKALPKIYGDRVTTTVEGGDKPLEIVDQSTDRDLARRVATLLAKGAKAPE